ncbi:hypothetical protein B0T17DRAFT_481398 [Bombardia bombarda]|uniref:Uncharacterized protein n=1 Tax=Bombardia bombarda TaxID=252184 RepID=A0AA40CER8_9PEZI|nr:hypothetical protein B0T17DRAFT_481398 [Bombardia bombarda]
MSRPTPRKSRLNRNNQSFSNTNTNPQNNNNNTTTTTNPRQPPQSDYESDAARYLESRSTPRLPHAPGRSNPELNLSVLARYLPGIQSILSIAANAVTYTFLEATQSWEKEAVEGTMFVCERAPLPTQQAPLLPRVTVFVLNRRGMDNLAVDLVRVSDCEMAQELIIFRLEGDEGGDGDGETDGSDGGGGRAGPAVGKGKKVIGIWIHADEEDTRQVNMDIILAAWQQARVALGAGNEPAAAWGQEADGQEETEEEGETETETEEEGQTEDEGAAPIPSPANNAIAVTARAHLSTISSFGRWLDEHTAAERKYGGVISKIKQRLEVYRERVIAAQRDHGDSSISQEITPWELVARTQSGTGGLGIVVTGPSPEDRVEITAKDGKEAKFIKGDQYLGYMSRVCRDMSQAERDFFSLVRVSREIEHERSQLSQPAKETVQTHIRLLKEYNDMKDIGQQLIGLVADNRGVRVGTLYEDGQYGVSAND